MTKWQTIYSILSTQMSLPNSRRQRENDYRKTFSVFFCCYLRFLFIVTVVVRHFHWILLSHLRFVGLKQRLEKISFESFRQNVTQNGALSMCSFCSVWRAGRVCFCMWLKWLWWVSVEVIEYHFGICHFLRLLDTTSATANQKWFNWRTWTALSIYCWRWAAKHVGIMLRVDRRKPFM